MTQAIYDKTKQYYLDKLEILNGKAFYFYLELKNKGLSNYSIRREAWKSNIWNEAKILLKELNIHLYGHLTCEICFTGFYSKKLSSFQLHHDNLKYNWEKVFNPEDTHVVHKMCHLKQLHHRWYIWKCTVGIVKRMSKWEKKNPRTTTRKILTISALNVV